MCGLIGVTGPPCPERMRLALEIIAHRGPDGRGIYHDDAITLGHCRLAIIDPANGQQPFATPDGRYVLAYNGELYNFPELADELAAAGVWFSTHGDTEVLLHWLVRHGRAGLERLNGMFAFALWDRQERTLLLARDRIGIKPLYIAQFPDTAGCSLRFSSEIKGLLPWLPRVRADASAIRQFLTFQNILNARTFFQDVEKVPPGGWLLWQGGMLQRGRFWRPVITGDGPPDPDQAAESFRATISAAVHRQMVSDVPLGAYLSSGYDSAAVASLAATYHAGPMHAFTGAFAEADYYDERQGASEVAERAGIQAHDILITPTHFHELLEKVLWHLDEPTLGTGALPQYVVSGLAAQRVKVVLTGHGGDELFAGYQVNKVALLRQALTSPARLLGVLAGLRRDEWSRVLYFGLFPLLFPEVGSGLFIMTPRRAQERWLQPGFLAASEDPFEVLARQSEGVKGYGDRLLHLYLTTYLPTLLIQEDKMGMAHSLEARMPLLDNTVVDLALALPLATKLAGGVLKAIPKRAMADLLPPLLASLPKRGFPTPFSRWFRSGLARETMAPLLEPGRVAARGILSGKAVDALWQRHGHGRTDHLGDYARANRLYSLALVELWHRMFVDRDPLAERFSGLSVGCFADPAGAA